MKNQNQQHEKIFNDICEKLNELSHKKAKPPNPVESPAPQEYHKSLTQTIEVLKREISRAQQTQESVELRLLREGEKYQKLFEEYNQTKQTYQQVESQLVHEQEVSQDAKMALENEKQLAAHYLSELESERQDNENLKEQMMENTERLESIQVAISERDQEIAILKEKLQVHHQKFTTIEESYVAQFESMHRRELELADQVERQEKSLALQNRFKARLKILWKKHTTETQRHNRILEGQILEKLRDIELKDVEIQRLNHAKAAAEKDLLTGAQERQDIIDSHKSSMEEYENLKIELAEKISEFEKLQASISDRSQEQRELVEKYEEQIAELKAREEETRIEADILKNSLAQHLDENHKKIAALTSQLETADQSLKEKEQEVELTQENLSQIEEKFNSIFIEKQSLEEKFAETLSSAQANFQSQLSLQNQQHADEMTSQKAKLDDLSRTHSQEIINCQKELQNQIEEIEKQKAAAIDEALALKDQLTKQQAETEEKLKSQEQNHKETLEKLLSEAQEDLKAQHLVHQTELEGSLREKHADDLANELKLLRNSLHQSFEQQLDAQKTDLEAKFSKDLAAKLEEQRTELQSQLAAAQDQLEGVKAETHQDRQDLESRLQKQKSEFEESLKSEKQAWAADLKETLAAQKKHLQAEKTEELEKLSRKMAIESDAINDQLKAQKALVEELRNTLKKSQDDLERKEQQIKQNTDGKSQVQAENQTLKHMYEVMLQKNHNLEKQNEEVTRKMHEKGYKLTHVESELMTLSQHKEKTDKFINEILAERDKEQIGFERVTKAAEDKIVELTLFLSKTQNENRALMAKVYDLEDQLRFAGSPQSGKAAPPSSYNLADDDTAKQVHMLHQDLRQMAQALNQLQEENEKLKKRTPGHLRMVAESPKSQPF